MKPLVLVLFIALSASGHPCGRTRKTRIVVDTSLAPIRG